MPMSHNLEKEVKGFLKSFGGDFMEPFYVRTVNSFRFTVASTQQYVAFWNQKQ